MIGIATSILFDALLHFLTNDGQSFFLIENANGFSLILNIVGRIVGLTFQLTETSLFPYWTISTEEDELGSLELESELSEELDMMITSSTTTWRKATCISN